MVLALQGSVAGLAGANLPAALEFRFFAAQNCRMSMVLSHGSMQLSDCRLQRADLVDSVITPAAFDAAATLAEATDANVERVAKYLARYQEVQAKRLAMEVR